MHSLTLVNIDSHSLHKTKRPCAKKRRASDLKVFADLKVTTDLSSLFPPVGSW